MQLATLDFWSEVLQGGFLSECPAVMLKLEGYEESLTMMQDNTLKCFHVFRKHLYSLPNLPLIGPSKKSIMVRHHGSRSFSFRSPSDSLKFRPYLW